MTMAKPTVRQTKHTEALKKAAEAHAKVIQGVATHAEAARALRDDQRKQLEFQHALGLPESKVK